MKKLNAKGHKKFVESIKKLAPDLGSKFVVTENGIRLGKFLIEVRLDEEVPVSAASPEASTTNPTAHNVPQGSGDQREADKILQTIMDKLKETFPTRQQLDDYLKEKEKERQKSDSDLATSLSTIAKGLHRR